MIQTRTLHQLYHVGAFEWKRARRTWRAWMLCGLYTLSSVTLGYGFIQVLGQMENSIANRLGVPVTMYPGAMMEEFRTTDSYLDLVSAFISDPSSVDAVIKFPVLSIFYLWVSFFLLPLLCAANAAESVAVDRENGALRFETLRVGRLELVLGRFLGQVALATLVSLVAISAMWLLGMGAMGGDNDPLILGGALLFLVVPSVVFCTPFISIGICCSLIGKSVVVARVSAIFLSLATWALYIVTLRLDALDHWAADVLYPLLPQYWRGGFWTLSWEALVSGVVCMTFAMLVLFGGHMWFRNQDL